MKVRDIFTGTFKHNETAMKLEHAEFHMRDVGLVVDTACPVFATSLDGVRTSVDMGMGC